MREKSVKLGWIMIAVFLCDFVVGLVLCIASFIDLIDENVVMYIIDKILIISAVLLVVLCIIFLGVLIAWFVKIKNDTEKKTIFLKNVKSFICTCVLLIILLNVLGYFFDGRFDFITNTLDAIVLIVISELIKINDLHS